MLDSYILDSVIGAVIVILMLSLIVESIQSVLKKLLKLKHRHLEESLLDLFETSLAGKGQTANADRFRIATLQLLPTRKLPSQLVSDPVRPLFEEVMKEFRKIGRVATSSKIMMDSISKADLLKVIRRVAPDTVLASSADKITLALKQYESLEKALADVKIEELSGEASVKYAKVQEILSPIFSDFKSVLKGKDLTKEVIIADLLGLRQLKSSDVLDLLAEIQKKVESDLARNDKNRPVYEKLDKDLKVITEGFIELQKKMDEAVAPLRLKLAEIENWYDTVMHSFEERYNRGMKTYAFIISFVVVVGMNANILNIYQHVLEDPTARNAILAAKEGVLENYENRLADSKIEHQGQILKVQNVPDDLPNEEPTQTQPQNGVAPRTEEERIQDIVNNARTEIDLINQQYASFGFRTWEDEFRTLSKKKAKLPEGISPGSYAATVIQSKSAPRWGNRFGHFVHMLLGWFVMAALLSIGAPFWHDILETLFGAKNLLRKRGDIKNVEHEPGAGKPQT